VVGAGIGGLTAALALARRGFRVVVLEQAARLSETGAGIQISPNAARILTALGVAERLKPAIVAPEAIRVRQASSGRDLVRLPLGATAEIDYGARYWVAHRGDLQAALLAAVRAQPDIVLDLGAKFEDLAVHPRGVTAEFTRGPNAADVLGAALVGADGLWSTVRARLGDRSLPQPARRTRQPVIHLWLGRNGHIVHYPVKGGTAVNIVAISADEWEGGGWGAPATREEVLSHFGHRDWAPTARNLLALPDRWLKWGLYDRPPGAFRGYGPVTLLGDASHPMLPFMAQGAAMAIEDAVVLAAALDKQPENPTAALRAYERERRARTVRVQRTARSNKRVYHLSGPPAWLRNLTMVLIGGELLIWRYRWIFGWRPK
jgi:salicylate hydroxylase